MVQHGQTLVRFIRDNVDYERVKRLVEQNSENFPEMLTYRDKSVRLYLHNYYMVDTCIHVLYDY